MALKVRKGQGQERDRGTCATLLQVVESTFAHFFIFSATYVYVKITHALAHIGLNLHTHTHIHTCVRVRTHAHA